ncbi:MAG: hypothetical protein RLZZ436_2125 [Planctomycetota bacterium]|jgi:hypothetical protein
MRILTQLVKEEESIRGGLFVGENLRDEEKPAV